MKKKLVTVFCTIIIGYSLLYLRIGFICGNTKFVQTGVRQSNYTLTYEKTRGQIYDCNFVPIVSQQRKHIASVLPTPKNLSFLYTNPALNIKSIDLSNKPFLTNVNTNEINVPNVTILSAEKRYSNNQIAQHIIGYVDNTGTNGVTGIEKAYNNILSSRSSESTISYLVDGNANPFYGVEPTINRAPFQTEGIVLTIDNRIQQLCEEIGEKSIKKGAIVIMEPSTGKLKAVASFPRYNANNIAQYISDEENAPLLNRAFSAYNVGSVFKIVTAAAALMQNLNPKEEYRCTGKIDVLDVTFRCHNREGHGFVNMKTGMTSSCNPYFINLSTKIPAQNLLDMAHDLSFGSSTELAPNFKTSNGNLPTITQLNSPAAVANLAFGQGELLATPIQITQLMSSVVNGGKTMRATLIEGETKDGKQLATKTQIPLPINAMKQDVADLIKEYLVATVMENSNQKAKPNFTTAGGKTGTAQTGKFENGNEKCHGWFTGFFPADNPKYVITVLTEDAKSGNQDASPVFQKIVDELTKPRMLPPQLRD